MNRVQRNFQSLKLLGFLSMGGLWAAGCGSERPKAEGTQSPAPVSASALPKASPKAPLKTSLKAQAPDQGVPVAKSTRKEPLKGAMQGEVWDLVGQQSFVGIEVLKRKGEHYARFGQVRGKATAKGSQWVGIDVEVQTKSFEADIPAFADHVRSKQFLDVKTYPQARFVSTSLRLDPGPVDNRYMLEGDLTLRGIKQQVIMQADLVTKGATMELKGQVPLEFKEFGMSQAGIANELIDGVQLTLRLQFKKTK